MKTKSAISKDGLHTQSLLINAMPGKHLVLLPDAPTFTIAAVSDDYLAAFGIQRESLVGSTLFEVFFSNGRDEAIAAQLHQSLTQVLQTNQTHAMADQRHQWPNVKTGLLEWRTWRPVSKPVLDSGGEVIYIIHSIEDITKTVQLVEVAEANQYLQTLINLMKEPLQVLQPVFENGEIIDFRFKLTNQAYASYANSTPEHLQGKRVGEVFPGYFETVSFTNPVETYKTGQPLTFEIHYNKDGLDLYNLMSIFKFNDEVVIYFTDYTRLRQLQLQLENKIEELKRSNDNLQQFAYVASHDLQEPLRKIQQFGHLLQTHYTNPTDIEIDYLARMQAAANRMTTLIRDLLAYSRISFQQETINSVSLPEVIKQVLDDLDLPIQESRAVVVLDSLPTVQGNFMQLGQVFQNLFSNALKFRRADVIPQIKVSSQLIDHTDLPNQVRITQSAKDYYRIDVSDNGIGFEEKHVERIFQVFQRLHGKNEFAGTGIGLSICEKVVTNHGGAITANSRPGQGAVFSVYLPA